MKHLTRRRFLGYGLAGVALNTLGPVFQPSILGRSLHAAMMGPSNPKKLLVVFLRGGNDGVNTCIPYGDSEYNVINRPQIFIPEADGLDLGNGFAGLHPAMSELFDLYNQGDVAVVHRTGYENLNRSHFEGQHFMESGVPGDSDLEEGWLYRHTLESYDLSSNPLAAASVSQQLMLLLKGETSLPHIADLSTYGLDVPGTSQEKLLGVAPSGGDIGSGLLGWYGKQSTSQYGYDALTGSTGLSMGATLMALEAAGIDPATYMPENGAVYPSSDTPYGFAAAYYPFFRQLRDAAMLLKQTELRVATIELGGFDTHAAQGAATGNQANLLAVVSHAMQTLSLDLESQWDDLLVLTLSEFGRTSMQNASNGTDHGEGSCLFVAGGGVNGGVYNCDSTTWTDGDMFSTSNGRYVAHLTDYRAVIAEILERHFGLDAASRDIVIPDLSSHAADPKFAYAGFLPE